MKFAKRILERQGTVSLDGISIKIAMGCYHRNSQPGISVASTGAFVIHASTASGEGRLMRR